MHQLIRNSVFWRIRSTKFFTNLLPDWFHHVKTAHFDRGLGKHSAKRLVTGLFEIEIHSRWFQSIAFWMSSRVYLTKESEKRIIWISWFILQGGNEEKADINRCFWSSFFDKLVRDNIYLSDTDFLFWRFGLNYSDATAEFVSSIATNFMSVNVINITFWT